MSSKFWRSLLYVEIFLLILSENLLGRAISSHLYHENGNRFLALVFSAVAAGLALQFYYTTSINLGLRFAERINLILVVAVMLGFATTFVQNTVPFAVLLGLLITAALLQLRKVMRERDIWKGTK